MEVRVRRCVFKLLQKPVDKYVCCEEIISGNKRRYLTESKCRHRKGVSIEQ